MVHGHLAVSHREQGSFQSAVLERIALIQNTAEREAAYLRHRDEFALCGEALRRKAAALARLDYRFLSEARVLDAMVKLLSKRQGPPRNRAAACRAFTRGGPRYCARRGACLKLPLRQLQGHRLGHRLDYA